MGGGCKMTVPFNASTNMPTFFTAPSYVAYRAFTTTYEALGAPYFQRETVLWLPRHWTLREATNVVPEEFIADKKFNYKKPLVENNVTKDKETIHTSNLPALVRKSAAPDNTICHGTLDIDQLPLLAENQDVLLATTNNQAELMRWTC
jgi:hypothetical protein